MEEATEIGKLRGRRYFVILELNLILVYVFETKSTGVL